MSKAEVAIEISKIAVGLLIAIVGGLWTLNTYTQDARSRSAAAVAGMSETLIGMQMNCLRADGPLLSLLQRELEDEEPGHEVRRQKCYESYELARTKLLSSSTLVRKPFFVRDAVWEAAWADFKRALEAAGGRAYDEARINAAWKKIMDLAGVFIVDPAPEGHGGISE